MSLGTIALITTNGVELVAGVSLDEN